MILIIYNKSIKFAKVKLIQRYNSQAYICQIFIVAFLQKATIEYSSESVCVCVCVCVCVSMCVCVFLHDNS